MIRGLAKRSGWGRELSAIEKSWLGYAIGYVWVFAFFFWSVPMWRWPRLYDQLATAERWRSILSKMTIVSASDVLNRSA